MDDHDFGGYATASGLKCTDGRIITPEAFAHQDKQQIPLVWQHGHDKPENVLGHAVLEHRAKGTYAYCYFNDTPAGQNSKLLVQHEDIKCLSIYANRLKENNNRVLHGNITEVSLVLNGANPGAKIDYVRIAHTDGDFDILDDEAVITSGLPLELRHSDDSLAHKTFQEVYDTFDEDQLGFLEVLVKKTLESKVEHSDTDDKPDEDKNDNQPESDADEDLQHQEGPGTMTRNVFDKTDEKDLKHNGMADGKTLSHAQISTILDPVRKGTATFKEAILAHVDEYGITNIEMLFPDAQSIDNKPEWITRRMEWVEGVLNGTRKLPWSKIKSLSADLTHEEARAKGYIKTNVKKDQFFAIAKRETSPQTIYKKQKLDRDDIIDITDFDVVAWLWIEIYFMVREEFARAVLVGDGREIDDEDKILESKIRPIAHDDTFYTDVVVVPANTNPDQLVEAVIRNRYLYKGNSPTAYMTTQVMTDMLLQKDAQLRRLYRNKAELAQELNVTEIVEVPVMEGQMRDGGEILIIIVNLSDYSVGSTKGGELTKFEDFDIDVNQYKYLLEGRASGALTKHKRAQVFIRGTGTLATPAAPTFVPSTGVLTIVATTGVTYKNQLTGDTLATGAQTAIAAGATINVVAVPNTGYYFPHNFDADWSFTRDA